MEEYQPKDDPIWSPWLTVAFGAAVIMLLLFVQTIVSFVFVAEELLNDPTIDPMKLLETMLSNGTLLSVATILGAAVCTGFIVFLIRIRRGTTISEYLGLKPLSLRAITIILAVSVALIVLSDWLSTVVDRPVSPDYMIDAYHSMASPVLLWMAVVVFGPLFEEVFFRGFLFPGLQKSILGLTGTIVVTSLVWSSLHVQYGSYEIISIFVLGIVLGLIRYKTGSLWGPLLMHMFWNLIAMIEVVLRIGDYFG